MSLEQAISQLPLELREHIYRYVIASVCQKRQPLKEQIVIEWVRRRLNEIIRLTVTENVDQGLRRLQEFEEYVFYNDAYSLSLKRRMLSKTAVTFNMLSQMVGTRWLITMLDVSYGDMMKIERQVEEANGYIMYIRYYMTFPTFSNDDSEELFDIPAMVGVLLFDQWLSHEMVWEMVGARCNLCKSSSSLNEHLAVLLDQSEWIHSAGNPEIYQQHLLQDLQAV